MVKHCVPIKLKSKYKVRKETILEEEDEEFNLSTAELSESDGKGNNKYLNGLTEEEESSDGLFDSFSDQIKRTPSLPSLQNLVVQRIK